MRPATLAATGRGMRVLSVVGTRPNFMKVAPICRALAQHEAEFESVLVHTGQHYDAAMSGSFFEALGLPDPDYYLGVGSGSHAEQTAAVMLKIEPVLKQVLPDIVVVVGDVNSTLACALTAKKLGMRVAHVEAGLRSGDWSMPEEINRLATDAISDQLFTTDRMANENLRREGVPDDRVHFVGNVMIDSLLQHAAAAEAVKFHETYGLSPRSYATLTLHRPSNVEDPDRLKGLLDAIREGLGDLPVIFPIHPRTRQRIESFGLGDRIAAEPGSPGIAAVDPLGYVEFLSLNGSARLVLTDSGGLQEETTILGVPCVTLRENTERPITIDQGTNILAGVVPSEVVAAIGQALTADNSGVRRPDKWDGQAAQRIVDLWARGL
jgi:UDP-N-acetylglucosamine 2-epimerase (non-hydrolysing)